MTTIPDIIDPLIQSLEKPTRIEIDYSHLTARESYLDTLMQEVAYEVIRREGVFEHLTGAEWDADAEALGKYFAVHLRPIIDEYVASQTAKNERGHQ